MRSNPQLPCHEDRNPGEAQEQRSQGLDRVPSILNTAPRQTDKEDRRAAQEQQRTDPVGLFEFLRQCEFSHCIQSHEEDRKDESETTEREVDVEAPTPCGVCDESPADDGPDDRSHGPGTLYESEVLGTVSQWHNIAEDYLAQSENASSTDTLDAPSHEHYREVVGHGAHNGTGSEEDQR